MAKKDISNDDLATLVQKGFMELHEKIDGVDGKVSGLQTEFQTFRIENAEEHKKMRSEIAHLAFMMTELVRRDEFNDLKKRVELLEAKRVA